MSRHQRRRRATKSVRAPAQLTGWTTRQLLERDDALHALALVRREGVAPTIAARRVGLSFDTMFEHVGSALKKTASGRWVAKPFDRLLREMRVQTTEGLKTLTIHDSRTASRIGEARRVVDEFLLTGDRSLLARLRRPFVVDGQPYYFELDPDQLAALKDAGALDYEVYDHA